MRKTRLASNLFLAGVLLVPVSGATLFDTGSPDGKLGAASRPDSVGAIEIESADDFLFSSPTRITGATFTGMLPIDFALGGVSQVAVEIYRVFPKDSANPPSGNVPTRVNSPSDVAFDTRDSAVAGQLSFTAALLSAQFSVANTIVNGINKIPNQTTGGEGAARGEEVLFTVTFNTPLDLPADHYFFVPQVLLSGSGNNFLWLSAPKPLFTGDLQSWIRNANLDPDWLRMGTDVIGGNPAPTFNMAFSLEGTSVPEPSTLVLVLAGLGLAAWKRRVIS